MEVEKVHLICFQFLIRMIRVETRNDYASSSLPLSADSSAANTIGTYSSRQLTVGMACS